MSGEQNELVARLPARLRRGQPGRLRPAVSEVRLDPEFEFARLGGQAAISGAEAFREWLEPDAIESLVMEPRKMQPVGRRVLVEQHATGRGAASGIELSLTRGRSGPSTRRATRFTWKPSTPTRGRRRLPRRGSNLEE